MTFHPIRQLFLLLALAFFCQILFEEPVQAAKGKSSLNKFELLTELVGQWEGSQPTPEGQELIQVQYELTAKGTALLETLFPGSAKEMISVYAQDGQDVIMTHYCMLGNHPRMRSTRQIIPNSLTLTYIDGTGMHSVHDRHMHELTITILDQDHMTHTWTLFDKGKRKITSTFNFARKNP